MTKGAVFGVVVDPVCGSGVRLSLASRVSTVRIRAASLHFLRVPTGEHEHACQDYARVSRVHVMALQRLF